MMLHSTPRLFDPDESVETGLRRELRQVSSDLITAHAALTSSNALTQAALRLRHSPSHEAALISVNAITQAALRVIHSPSPEEKRP
jgi:hypothetical protein